MKIGADDYVQARATDNFSIGIPGRLLGSANTAHAEAFLAVEDPVAPWPVLAKSHEKLSAGPFFIVWRLEPSAHISREYWAYQLAALTVTDSPLKRWPGLAVAADVPPVDPIRAGLDRYVEHCISCHRFNGERGRAGPDLGRPMNPSIISDPALKKLIRNPSSVRKWPEQRCPASMSRTSATAISTPSRGSPTRPDSRGSTPQPAGFASTGAGLGPSSAAGRAAAH
jgi:hypothetical protein